MLTDEEAVAIACGAADRMAESDEEYKLNRVAWSEEDRSWWVHLVTVVPRPGGHVTVIVSSESGDYRVVPGK